MTNLEKWRFYCKDFESPDIYITWTYYSMISAALQRRVWIGFEGHKEIYPNLYVVFIGPPGVGKTISAGEAKKVFKSFDSFTKEGKPSSIIKLAPDSVTLEALTRYMHNNYTTTKWPEGYGRDKNAIYTSCPMAFFCGDELGTLIKENTNDLVIFLNQGFDCGDFHRETKTQGVDVVKNMCITFLGSATPEWIKQSMNSRLLGEGFTARVIFVYADKKSKLKYLINFSEEQLIAHREVRAHVEKLTKLFGRLTISSEVFGFLEDWYSKKIKLNNDKKLIHYYERKKIHVLKLAACFHFGESTEMELTLDDCKNALMLLANTELDMHKALQGSGRNPINTLSVGIESFVERSEEKFIPHKRILVEFFDEGTNEEIVSALQFLIDTGKLRSINNSGIMGYTKDYDE